MLTESKSLFDVISKGSGMSEKRLMINVAPAREVYQNRDINNIGFVSSESNLADGLTKVNKQRSLLELLRTSRHSPVFDQWIMSDHDYAITKQ